LTLPVHSEVKSGKAASSRNRWARSVPFELDGELYAVDLEDGYQPVAPGNRSHWSPGNGVRWNGAAPRDAEDEEEVEGFSGMGITAMPAPTPGSKVTPSAALKVTYR